MKIMKTRTVLTGFLGVVTLAWAWDALWTHPVDGALPWLIRQHTLYLTGLYALSLMSLVMVLATRQPWLESALGGMDRVYRLHKHAGILAIVFGAVHWLSKLASGPLKAWIGAADRPAKEAVLAFLEPSRAVAKDLGEWAIYLLLAMLILTLWKRFPYRSWRLMHRIMPALYLVLVFHAIALMPLTYWIGPSGVLQGALLAAGVAASICALAGRIGRKRQHRGTVHSVRRMGEDVIEVVCEMGASWPGHRAGQFAFVTFDHEEGAHPFTIASANHEGTRKLTFQIKSLGDYTGTLAGRLVCGQAVCVEGPYGRFLGGQGREREPQVWVAGGVGITPFLAWLDDIRRNPENAPRAQLHYCVRDAQNDPFFARLRALCADIPSVTLHVHDASRQERFDVRELREVLMERNGEDRINIWFCGPAGLARSLRQGFRHGDKKKVRIWQEAFEMR